LGLRLQTKGKSEGQKPYFLVHESCNFQIWVQRYNDYFIPAIPINDDFNFCKPPPCLGDRRDRGLLAGRTCRKEGSWRAEKKRVAVPKEWIYFVSICFLGRHINQ
jgi:hypothetical protein